MMQASEAHIRVPLPPAHGHWAPPAGEAQGKRPQGAMPSIAPQDSKASSLSCGQLRNTRVCMHVVAEAVAAGTCCN